MLFNPTMVGAKDLLLQVAIQSARARKYESHPRCAENHQLYEGLERRTAVRKPSKL